ncbi:hypothetical protein H696_02186 [Fonticula alba]|uniref:DUF4476 domain-containing protein n=1 Tax=Fonticula alba TaxID=691883 RepID=A0A058ZBC7_FONAL|nr:hypothetical protein H696_02186 [Fonticula alba]KCV71236.1 hypothetical protein H696_02186 [Fonticula alba]|eukprot:XP_009494359.1 hypothetical protein H696_02186 [Fonticula alba]
MRIWVITAPSHVVVDPRVHLAWLHARRARLLSSIIVSIIMLLIFVGIFVAFIIIFSGFIWFFFIFMWVVCLINVLVSVSRYRAINREIHRLEASLNNPEGPVITQTTTMHPPPPGVVYPPQPGYPPQAGAYPPQGPYPPQGAYPPQPGYPPQGAYPPQPGYPPQGGEFVSPPPYPGNSSPGYPPASPPAHAAAAPAPISGPLFTQLSGHAEGIISSHPPGSPGLNQALVSLFHQFLASPPPRESLGQVSSEHLLQAAQVDGLLNRLLSVSADLEARRALCIRAFPFISDYQNFVGMLNAAPYLNKMEKEDVISQLRSTFPSYF